MNYPKSIQSIFLLLVISLMVSNPIEIVYGSQSEQNYKSFIKSSRDLYKSCINFYYANDFQQAKTKCKEALAHATLAHSEFTQVSDKASVSAWTSVLGKNEVKIEQLAEQIDAKVNGSNSIVLAGAGKSVIRGATAPLPKNKSKLFLFPQSQFKTAQHQSDLQNLLKLQHVARIRVDGFAAGNVSNTDAGRFSRECAKEVATTMLGSGVSPIKLFVQGHGSLDTRNQIFRQHITQIPVPKTNDPARCVVGIHHITDQQNWNNEYWPVALYWDLKQGYSSQLVERVGADIENRIDDVVIEVSGFGLGFGAESKNIAGAQTCADKLRELWVLSGIDPGRLVARGNGSSGLIPGNVRFPFSGQHCMVTLKTLESL